MDTKEGEGLLHVRLRGELDVSTAAGAEDELRRVEDHHKVLLLDLSGLSSLDSAGLRVLVAADKRSREAGRRMVVVRGPDTVHQVLMITQLDRRLEIVDDVAQFEGG